MYTHLWDMVVYNTGLICGMLYTIQDSFVHKHLWHMFVYNLLHNSLVHPHIVIFCCQTHNTLSAYLLSSYANVCSVPEIANMCSIYKLQKWKQTLICRQRWLHISEPMSAACTADTQLSLGVHTAASLDSVCHTHATRLTRWTRLGLNCPTVPKLSYPDIARLTLPHMLLH